MSNAKSIGKVFIFLIIGLIFLGLTVAGALAVSDDQTEGQPYYYGDEKAQRLSIADFEGSKYSVFSPLFLFTQIDVNFPMCSLQKNTNGAYQSRVYLVKTGGKAVDGTNLNAGALCPVGSYIKFLKCDNSAGANCVPLFGEYWYKSSSTNLMYYKDFAWSRNQPDFWGAYSCWSCPTLEEPTLETTYSCYNSKWSGEPNTKYSSLNGICAYGCKKTGTYLDSFDKNSISSELCATQPPQTVDPCIKAGTCCEKTNTCPPPQTTTSLSGTWSNIKHPSAVKPNEVFSVTASFTASKTGKYYFEAGMTETPMLAITTVEAGTKCDGDINWAGTFFDLSAGDTVNLEFKPTAQSTEGNYGVVVGAYTGCLPTEKHPEYTGEKIVVAQSPIKVDGVASTLSGEWSKVNYQAQVEPNKPFTINAIFTAHKTGEYYLEAGMEEKPLLGITSVTSGSLCDGDINWAGKKQTIEAGKSVELQFTPTSQSKVGTYGIVVGAYERCPSEGETADDVLIAKVGGQIKVSETPISCSGNDCPCLGSDCDKGLTVFDYVGFGLIGVGVVVSLFGFWIYGIIGIIVGVVLALI